MSTYIVFTQSKHRLWGAILKQNYSHAYVIMQDAYNVIQINPSQSFLITKILPVQAKNFDIHKHISASESAIKIDFYPRTSKKHFGIFGLRTCTSFCKYILGLRVLSAITPWQLYKQLLRANYQQRSIMGIKNIQRIV